MNREDAYVARHDPQLAAYRRGDTAIPGRSWLWPLYGAGLENLGQDGKPILVDTPACGPDQLLVRHDAVGLCFSDTKIIKAGDTHPRLMGRNMKANPVVLGHEVALTVVQVGANLADQFRPGDRFIVQADIYYQGVGLAYGYALQGGLSQYNLIGQEILEGDEGCYLLPVKPETGYAQAALTEPWACVTASYDVTYRVGWKPGGRGADRRRARRAGATTPWVRPMAAGSRPARDHPGRGGRAAGRAAPPRRRADGFDAGRAGRAPAPRPLAQAKAACGRGRVRRHRAARGRRGSLRAGRAAGGQGRRAQPGGRAGVLRARPRWTWAACTMTTSAWWARAEPDDRRGLCSRSAPNCAPAASAAFLGAAGPMGQMHVQRALQAHEGPRLIVATDLVPERLDVLETKYRPVHRGQAWGHRVELRVRPRPDAPAEFNASLMAATGGAGFDDIVVLVPSPGVIAGSVGMLAAERRDEHLCRRCPRRPGAHRPAPGGQQGHPFHRHQWFGHP